MTSGLLAPPFRLDTFAPLCFYTSMISFHSPKEMQAWSIKQIRDGKKICLVPTMGFLHDGHLSLIRLARQHGDLVVVSIFVNPTQFGPREDFSRYPRDLARDSELCKRGGVDVIFNPDAAGMYPDGYSVYVNEESLSSGLCGSSRPGHFRGVVTVVAKLFNIVLPHVAVFGEKDAQQLRIIRRMVRDMNFPVTIVSGPTARESDGLAMSSRNTLLKPAERDQAVQLSRSLNLAKKMFQAGERDADKIKAAVAEEINKASLGRVDYIELVDDESLAPLNKIDGKALLAIAVYFSTTRLIDNVVLGS